MDDLISRQAAIDALTGVIDRFEGILADIRESKVDDSVCGMCEYDGAYMGQSGDWCNECPGFDKDDCFKLSDRCRKRWMDDAILLLPSAQPERKKGQWIRHDEVKNVYGGICIECPECGEKYVVQYIEDEKYCRNCGADMRQKEGSDGNRFNNT